MRKFIITAELRDLEMKFNRGQISYSRMVELLNEKALAWLKEYKEKGGCDCGYSADKDGICTGCNLIKV